MNDRLPSERDPIALDFLSGGEMGSLMRAHDWSSSPLGAPSTWPQSLRSVVGLLLGSKFPMFVAWGPELGFLYNDAYAEILGAKHPRALGLRFHDIWSEIWSDISPLIDAALAGEASYRENLPLLMNRKGFDEQTWFTFSYSPVRDESGQVAGMFCAVAETTGQILAERRQAFRIKLEETLRILADPREVMEAAVEALGQHLGANRVGYSEVQADDETIVCQTCFVNGVEPLIGTFSLRAFGPDSIARQRAGQIDVCDDLVADPAQVHATWVAIETRAFVSVPLVRNGRFTASLYVNFREVHRWSSEEVELIEEVAARTWSAVERARAEAALADSEKRLRAFVTASSDVVYRMSPDWAELRQLEGRGLLLDAESPNDAWLSSYVHPDDQPQVVSAIQEATRAKSMFELEHRVRRADGTFGWVHSRALPILREDGEVVEWFGTASDVTARRQAEESIERLALELAQERTRLATLIENLLVGVALVDIQGTTVLSNPAFRRYRPDGVIPSRLPDDREQWIAHDDQGCPLPKSQYPSARALRGELVTGIEFLHRLPDGQESWTRVSGIPIRDSDGRVSGALAVIVDIDDIKRSEEHQRLLINELNHRVKNTLATVQSIARQTLRNAPTMEDAKTALEGRLLALSRAHDVLTSENWEGAELREIAAQAVEPYSNRSEDRLHLNGPKVRLSPRMALAVAMMLQELATNAVKYGALSSAKGEIRMSWRLDGGTPGRLRFRWEESGGPPVQPPTRRGFGSRLIERSLALDLDGDIRIDFAATGVICTVDVPIG
ncbi:HWE histidine kinase domain-containing protein [Microvirga calopogonii]|uniref:HWE histidine kinase domain-containing protein n=1 Tax=Microvirga calopogonii TaxID=2078013 RepID=UPI000E0E04DB|nr:HWE histidine kinase domain-containing protein [Microvirga calopogonii]